MSNKAIDWGESASEGDFGAAKKLAATFAVIIGVLALVAATVGVAAMNAGSSVRTTIGEALTGAADGASESSGSTHGWGGS